LPMVLQQIYFSEWRKRFFKYFTNSATDKQITIKIITLLLIFEKENGIVLIITIKLTQNLHQCCFYFVKSICGR
jgi:hypothetical protein